MPPLPVVSGTQAVKVFERFGWVFDHQTGSHMILIRPGKPGLLSVPKHRELDRGTLNGLIRQAGLTVQEFVDAMKRK